MLERSRRVVPLLVLSCLLVASVALTACFHDGGGSSADAQKVINETFSGDKKVDSGNLKLELEAKVDASGLAKQQLGDKPVTVSVSGPFQSTGDKSLPKFDFDLSASAAGQTFTAGAVSTGSEGFISYQGTDYEVDSKTFKQFKDSFEKQEADNQKQQQTDLAALGVDPKKWITDAKDEGTADVGGTETNHVSAQVNIPAFLDDVNNLLQKSGQLNLNKEQQQQLPKSLTDAQKKQAQEAVKSAKIDVYSGKDDKILRKLNVTAQFGVPDSLKSQAQGVTGGDITLTAEIADLNKPQTITAPKDAKPLSELQTLLGSNPLGALGAAGATGATPDSGTTPTPDSGASAPDAGASQKYLECLQKAGNDQEKARNCASELQGE
ncbi:MAG: hypothetical protein WDZ37_05345 [Solirubrobacterales bacterium]